MKKIHQFALALVFALATAISGHSQEIWGTLVGTVTDSSGASVPGATAKITNENTGLQRSFRTEEAGNYQFLKLPAGTYTLEVEKDGFKRYVQTGITVRIATVQRADVMLEVGSVTQAVTVEADAQLVQTVSMEQGGTMPRFLLQNLPTLGLNWTNLSLLFPGAQQDPDRLGHSYNGGRTVANNFLVNGTDANDPALNTILVTPSPMAIEEFRLVTNSMNPEYGRNSGSRMEVATRSGTNSFHGGLFYYYRNKGLNAREFFQTRKPDFNRNQWGGAVGGPIVKDRTFFFFDWMGLKEKVPATASLSPNDPVVFSPAERQGDFSASDPFTGNAPDVAPWNGQPWSTIFPDNTIPPSMINPIAAEYLNFVPLPNLPGNRFSSVAPSPTDEHDPGRWGVKIDHRFADNDSLTGYFFWRKSERIRPFPFTGANVPGFGDTATTNVRQFTLSHNHMMGGSVVNEIRYGYSRLNFNTVNPDRSQPGNKPPADWGFTNITVQSPEIASAPKIEIGDTLVLGFSDNGPQPRIDDTHQVTESLAWIRGRHSMKFGVDYRLVRVYNPLFANAHNGVFTFDGEGTYSTGNPYADFLLGVPTSYFQGSGNILDARDNLLYLYAQDIFKVTPSLTLTYGVGYHLDFNWENIFNDKKSMISFRPGCQSSIYPTAPEGICYTGDPGIPRGGAPIRKKNFAPRIGFAWSPRGGGRITGGGGRFVIRAGYGIYYDNSIGEGTLQFLGNPPLGLSVSGAPDPTFADPWTSFTAGASIPNPFPAAAAPPIGSNVDFSPFMPLIVTSMDPNFRIPRSHNYHFTIERQFGESWIARWSYVGSQGRNLAATYEGNPVDSALAASLGCPAFFVQLFCPQVTRFVPGDLVSSVFVQGSFANSSYNSFQASLEKRVSRGLAFLASYTLSKSIDNSNGLEGDASAFQTVNPFDPGRDRALSTFDARHRLVLSYVWDLPGPTTGVLGHVAGGWRVGGITTFATGFPVFLTTSDDRCLIGLALTFGNTYCRPNLVGEIRTFDPRDDVAVAQNLVNPRGVAPSNAFFDPTAFARVPPGSGQLGTAGRNHFSGPGFNNFDLNIAKDIRITESVRLTPRFEFFNAFNHAQFQNPTGNANSTSFGRVTRTRGGRIIQLGMQLIF